MGACLRDAQSLAGAVEHAVAAGAPLLGRAAHAAAVKFLSPSLPAFLCNHLVNLYAKLDLPSAAAAALFLHPDPSVVSHTALIAGLVHNARHHTALAHFLLMLRRQVRPNDFTLPCVLKAAAALPRPDVGLQLHSFACKSGLQSDVYVGCSLLNMYCKLGSMVDARRVFDELPETTVVAWNALMTSLVLNDRPAEVAGAFLEMRREGTPPDPITLCAFLNACAGSGSKVAGEQLHGFVVRAGFSDDVSVGNGLIDFYGKCHDPDAARSVFDGMPRRNDVSWSSMAVAHAQNGMDEEAFRTYLAARRGGCTPTNFMLSSVLTACCGLARFDLGRSLHAAAVRSCLDGNLFVGTALVDMYGKCGGISDAEQVFAELPTKNLVTWNSMIGGYARQGLAELAISAFQDMVSDGEVPPNYVTFLNVTTACGRGGLVESGMEVFETMKERYMVEPRRENYAAVVDMLGRAGRLHEAHGFIARMPMEPTAEVWGALLGACKLHGNAELGKLAAGRLFELDPEDSGNHVVLSNMLASAGRWGEASGVREEMRQSGIRKDPGCSWVAWRGSVHVFRAKDTGHEMDAEIRRALVELRRRMAAAGYVADTRFALFDVEEEEKEGEVADHSEKLAVAFGLLCLPAAAPIRITKNLRVCGDCHTAIKFVSMIEKREIVVRDTSRFHRFKDGLCSCADFW